MLAEICDWFTESFDTADLKEAKTLLDELSLYLSAGRSQRQAILCSPPHAPGSEQQRYFTHGGQGIILCQDRIFGDPGK